MSSVAMMGLSFVGLQPTIQLVLQLDNLFSVPLCKGLQTVGVKELES